MTAGAAGSGVYLQTLRPLVGRALSGLDAEPTSPSHGSFDRTWWCWKFSDFSAARLQEGAHVLAWLATAPASPYAATGRARMVELADAALRFWTRLQHRDGSFDEAYPFERSLAATAFTGFYLGLTLERLRAQLDPVTVDRVCRALGAGADWLAANGERHGILSNHLAAAAAALQIVGDVLGTDRFSAARDRFLGVIYQHQHPREGWMREYGGADPGYQSHGMFYLATLEQRTHDGELFERLVRASDFLAWFVHPDGTVGGEYASRGTKFAFPAAFEMLASRVPSAGGIACHLRRQLACGRGVGAREMDAWNQFPLLNNLVAAIDNADDDLAAADLPWCADGARAVFAAAGLAVAHAGGRIFVTGTQMGGALKLFAQAGSLLYEDCGYATAVGAHYATSQGESIGTMAVTADGDLAVEIAAPFRQLPALRFDPWRFIAFRLFTLTLGRMPIIAQRLKAVLVSLLIRRRPRHPGELRRRIRFGNDGSLRIDDEVSGVSVLPLALARQVPMHMGSSRYADAEDWGGAELACPPLERHGQRYTRRFEISAQNGQSGKR